MPFQIKANILYEDDYLILFNKPSGLVVNISDTSPSNTLQNFLQDSLSQPEDVSEFAMRSGILHRLDKYTSGVLIVAKNKQIFEQLKEQFVKRSVKKHYIAMLFGHLDDKEILINAPIKRDPRNRKKMCIHIEGKSALTRILLTKNIVIADNNFCFVDIYPFTGRTHQIRIHTSSINHPVVGDEIYLTKVQFNLSQTITNRLMLHSKEITFFHPIQKKDMTISAPLPEVFEEMYSKYL